MEREILGHIDCPHCGWKNGMRVTPDRSGAPFGYCEANCSGQLRTGGNAARVRAFYAKYPHIKEPGSEPVVEEKQEPDQVPVEPEKPAPEKKKAAPAEKKPVPKREQDQAPVVVPKKPTFFEMLGGSK